jgi:hypothetical protein
VNKGQLFLELQVCRDDGKRSSFSTGKERVVSLLEK